MSSKTTSFIHISTVSLLPIIILSFVEDCTIGNFYKTISKDNAENSCSSTNDGKISVKFQIKKKRTNKQENGFKGLKKIFANNVV
jgi:hypothetical protein